MRQYVLEPKKTEIIKARLEGDEIVIRVPDTDDELTELAGRNEDGSPKLTLLGLAQEYIAVKVQAAVSKFLTESAIVLKDANGKEYFAPEQFASEAELAEIVRKAEPEAYRLLARERASSGRKSAAEIKAEAAAEERAKNVAIYRNMLATADAAMRPMVIHMITQLGYTELL